MKPEKQRIAIAEFCGFNTKKEQLGGVFIYRDSRGQMVAALPDYLNDLNAMFEADKYAAERGMDADQWEEYGKNLERVHPTSCIKNVKDDDVDYYDFATIVTAPTAAQRAEALLRTIGKWEEETQ